MAKHSQTPAAPGKRTKKTHEGGGAEVYETWNVRILSAFPAPYDFEDTTKGPAFTCVTFEYNGEKRGAVQRLDYDLRGNIHAAMMAAVYAAYARTGELVDLVVKPATTPFIAIEPFGKPWVEIKYGSTGVQ